jgi:hypothetical protein
MRKFLKEYGKAILAVLSIGLMIAFVLPMGMKQAGAGGGNKVVGYLGNQKLYSQDKMSARQSWELLEKQRIDMQGHSLGFALLGPNAAAQITLHPDLFPLLIQEAQQMGVAVSKDEVETVVSNALRGMDDEDRLDHFRRAIADALMVQNAFKRAASVVKVSEPLKREILATYMQGISVNLVEFDAAKFKAKVPAPTTQQLTEQFDKFKDTIKGNADPKTNPFGVGYKYPNRVKLQYIQIPRLEVRRVVEASRDARRWDVDSYKYYSQHQGEFATTQPASQPANQAFSLDTIKKSATTRPFEEVKGDIKNQLISAETEKLQAAIYEKISSTLGGDYMAYKSAAGTGATTQPANAPAPVSSLKVPYNTFDYLKALAAEIQSLHKVLPTVVSLNDRYVTPEEAVKIQGLGDARVGQEDFGTFLESSVSAFVPSERSGDSDILHKMQPSSPLRDTLGNIYIIRMTDADPSHAPATLAEVQDRVRDDWVSAEAYRLARSPADKLLGESKVNGLKSAAAQSALPVITTGVFTNRPNAQIGNYTLPDDGKAQFIEGAFKLLSTPPAHPGGQPVRVVEMPTVGKLAVTELASVAPLWNQQNKYAFADQASNDLAQQQVRLFMQSWFDWNSAVARLQYRAVEVDNKEPQGPSPVPPPIF